MKTVRAGASAASVRRVWRIYRRYLTAFVAVAKMEMGAQIPEKVRTKLRDQVILLDHGLDAYIFCRDKRSLAGRSTCWARSLDLWYAIRDFPHPVSSDDRYAHMVEKLSKCDDMLRDALASYYNGPAKPGRRSAFPDRFKLKWSV